MVKSNKLFKILAIMLVAICLVSAFSGVVNAGTTGQQQPTGGGGITVNDYTSSITASDPGGQAGSKIKSVANSVLFILQAVGMVAGVAIIAYMGIKYITSSPDGKAEIKKQAAIYILGAALLMLAPTIAQLVFNAVNK